MGVSEMPVSPAPDPAKRYGMVIDVNRCVGCQTCTIACKHYNDTQPDVQWRRVIDVEQGTFPSVDRFFLVTGCQHCAEPPCVPVCPTGATKQRADGLVTMDYEMCIGCAYCAVSCPYQARTIVHDHNWYYGRETRQEEKVAHDEREGVAQKCTFCIDKVSEAADEGLTAGVDPEVTPACAASCIASVISFGDFKDPESNVSQLVKDREPFQMHAELGTDPQIKYLYRTSRTPDDGDEAARDMRLRDPANPLVGKLQTFWDWRAAMNWCFGGLASGFAIVSWIMYLTGGLPADQLRWHNFGAAVLMSIGLFFVFLKIGRKFRFWRAISRPHTSWMTRELYAVAVFFPAVLAGMFLDNPAIYAVAGLSAAAFLWCQAKILHMAKGIPAWRAPSIPAMIVATGLLEGFGLLLGLGAIEAWQVATGFGLRPWGIELPQVFPLIGIALILANAALWRMYRGTARANGIPPLSRDVLARTSPVLHGLGHAVPLALLVGAIVFQDINVVLFGTAGVLMIAGGLFWKFMIVARASYQQGFAAPPPTP